MDPLTAFGLACGVIQVVDFGTKTLITCKEIYKGGSSSEYQELEDLTKNLVDVRSELDLPSVHQSGGSFDKTDERSLLELASRCSATADQLIEKLHSLKIEGPHKKRQAVLKTGKLLWEKSEIHEIQKRLDGYRDALDTEILINLRQRLDLASLQHNKEFQDLDRKIQKLINSLSQGPKSFEELKDLIQNENEKTREHVSSKFQEHERRRAEENYRKRLLESLWFAEILSREETIAEAHNETFEWIFDKSGHAVRPWNNFIAWLERGEGTYWINGKAGSGKSTLMNFLCQDKRTIDALTIWSRRKDILMPKFFLWSGGSTIQKSFEGLLRSLLWQILKKFPEMNILPNDVESRSEQSRSISHEHGSIGAWTKRRLQRTLQKVIEQLKSSCCFCFFIDGLDEFDEDENDLIAFVQYIVSSTGVKVCSSSRPHKAFEDAFGSSAKLRLQDLTYKDIQRYVTDKFQGVPQLESMTTQHEYEMVKLKEEIVHRAEGVFLWVSLAVKDQIRGLRNEDSPEQLQERLAGLPSEVEGIYLRMLLHIDKPYRQEVSGFLQMALHRPFLTILDLALASYKDLDNMLLSADGFSKRELVLQCQRTRKRIIATCAGLLEVREHPTSKFESDTISIWGSGHDSLQLAADPDGNLSALRTGSETMDDPDREQETVQPDLAANGNKPSSSSETNITDGKAFDLESNATVDFVDFVHRTAVEFLRHTERGGKFLDANLSPDFDPQILYVKVLLGRLRLLGPKNYLNINEIMEQVALAEDRTGMAQTKLCELIDRTMSIIDHGHSDWHPKSHWCTRWWNLAKLLVREQDRLCLDTRTITRSSSSDSFYSAMSEPMTQSNSDVAMMESLDFLSFAASHGLSHYVQQTLGCREKNVGPELLDHLLYCSTFLPSYQGAWYYQKFRSFRVLPEVLRQGGNPNRDFFTRTIWKEFLERTLFAWHKTHNNIFRSKFPLRELSDDWAAITVATVAFVEYGADVQPIWTFHFSSVMSVKFPNSETSPEHETMHSTCSFDIQLSPLSAIHLCLRDRPQYPRIREMCISRGALSYSRCTILEVNSSSPHAFEEDAENRKEYELSEYESKEFLALFENYMAGRDTEYSLVMGDLRRQILDFYHRLDEVRPHSSSSRSSNPPTTGNIRERGSEWSTYTSLFQPGTMGLKIFRAQKVQKEYVLAHTSPRWWLESATNIGFDSTTTCLVENLPAPKLKRVI